MMIQTTVGVPMDAMVLNNYFRTLINLFFKILPIKESGESSLDTYNAGDISVGDVKVIDGGAANGIQ